MKRSRIILLLSVLLSLIMIGHLWAEVSVVLDGQGNYLKLLTLFKVKGQQTFYWESVRRGVPNYLMLNLDGDMNGDGKPQWAEHPFEKSVWVVWPYFDGNDFEIVYSRWTEQGWIDPALIETTDNDIDDVEPTISFEASGIPFVAFTRKAQTSQIYVTAFISHHWISPVRVSDPSMDCSKPAFIFQRDAALIAFLTPEGIKFVPLDNLGDGEGYETDGIEEGPNPLPENTPSVGNGSSHR